MFIGYNRAAKLAKDYNKNGPDMIFYKSGGGGRADWLVRYDDCDIASVLKLEWLILNVRIGNELAN